ncbi:MAG TPA: hypothetical protein VM638_02705 [Actinomycetota bacterium]|nr:hypothetical protein [Actinomycetota bacterium]
MKEIEEVRGRLGDQVEELESRLPAIARTPRRALGFLAATGAAGAALWVVAGRIRQARRPVGRIERVARKLPDRIANPAMRGIERAPSWTGWALAGAGFLAATRIAEMRRLKRIERAIQADLADVGR